jgi:pyruvate,water dikinase
MTRVQTPQSNTASSAGTPEIPVVWPSPDDASLSWIQLNNLYPRPTSPMTGTIIADVLPNGFNAGCTAYDLLLRTQIRRINTYIYTSVTALSQSAAGTASPPSRSQQVLDAARAELGQRWRREWLPEAESHLAYWRSFDLAGAPPTALAAHWDETLVRIRRLYELQFLVSFPFWTALSLFEDFYVDLFEPATGLEAYRLLQGFDNLTLQADRALWRLSRQARAVPAVRRIVEEQPVSGLIPALEGSVDGREFLAALRAYLDEYGQRGIMYNDLDHPSWIEEPTPALQFVKQYLARPDHDPEAELAALAAEREQAVAAARRHLHGYPAPIVAQFEALLQAAQDAVVISEDHEIWLAYRPFYELRRVILECGRRLVTAGGTDTTEEVFYLTPDELSEALQAQPDAGLRDRIAARRAEVERFKQVTPPPTLGAPQEGLAKFAPTVMQPNEQAFWRAFSKNAGAPPAPVEPGSLRGQAASPGVARGPARVLRSLAEADRVRPGEVLVATNTAPPWTPLFASVAAVVTDVGGVLCHCAVVAREYRIPAVVGTGAATTTLADGQLVEVDGNAGLVRILG